MAGRGGRVARPPLAPRRLTGPGQTSPERDPVRRRLTVTAVAPCSHRDHANCHSHTGTLSAQRRPSTGYRPLRTCSHGKLPLLRPLPPGPELEGAGPGAAPPGPSPPQTAPHSDRRRYPALGRPPGATQPSSHPGPSTTTAPPSDDIRLQKPRAPNQSVNCLLIQIITYELRSPFTLRRAPGVLRSPPLVHVRHVLDVRGPGVGGYALEGSNPSLPARLCPLRVRDHSSQRVGSVGATAGSVPQPGRDRCRAFTATTQGGWSHC